MEGAAAADSMMQVKCYRMYLFLLKITCVKRHLIYHLLQLIS